MSLFSFFCALVISGPHANERVDRFFTEHPEFQVSHEVLSTFNSYVYKQDVSQKKYSLPLYSETLEPVIIHLRASKDVIWGIQFSKKNVVVYNSTENKIVPIEDLYTAGEF